MGGNTSLGIVLVLAAGVMVGNSMTPLQRIRHWRWENTWLVFSLVSLVIVPLLLALYAVPNLWSLYSQIALGDLTLPFVFGMGWGVAQVLFGISVVRLGMGLAFAIVVGLGAVLGTLIPVLAQHRDVLTATKGALLLAGTFLMTVGLIACRYAGQIRDRLFRNADSTLGNSKIDASNYRSGLLIAIVSGLLSAFLNFALAFGDGITHAAVDAGANPASASYAIWPVALAGGLVPNAGYSVYLLNRNASWKLFRECWPDLNWATLMGLLWMGAVAIYSVSTSYLGELGTSAGWGLYEIFMILAANASGLLAGEWRGVGTRAVSISGTGLLFLIVATFFLARSNV